MNTGFRYKLIDKASTEGIAIHENGKIKFTNEALSRMTRYEQEELVGMLIDNLLIYPENANIEKLYSGVHNTILEANCRRKDSTTLPVELISELLDTTDAGPTRAIIFRDISKRKVIENELRRTAEEYRRLFEDSNDAIYISSREGRIFEVNQAAMDMFGYTREEMLKLDTHILYKNPEDRYKFQIEVETYRAVKDYEVSLKKKDGTTLHCLLSSSIKLGTDGSVFGYQGIIKDITAIKKTDELRKAKDLAEQSVKLKEQFLANMSHEMRTPLHAIFGITNLMLDSPLEEKQRQYIELVKSSTDHLLVIINDILDFSKIEAGKMIFEESEFSIFDLISNLCQTLQFRIEEKNLEFDCQIDQNLPEMIIGDSVRLNQILINLLINAIKFTEKGKIALTVSLDEETNNKVTIGFKVSDTGIGIPGDKLDHIFESFTQVSQDTTRKFGGTGLGLTITRKLVHLQGGTLQVSSKLDVGSTFDCKIKYKKGKALAAKHIGSLTKKVAIQDLGKLKILIVEDNKVNQLVTSETIKKWGKSLTIDIAENGVDAVNKVKTENYDLVIMDIQMPVMDGLDATVKIRTELNPPNCYVPIMAMTAYATTGEAEKCFTAGMNEYISKPFDPKELYQKLAFLTGKILINNNGQQGSQTSSNRATHLVPALEISYLNKITEGDIVLRKKMIDLIIKETPPDIANLKRLIDEKDWPALKSLAHKFKSTAIFLGNKQLETLIKTVEDMAGERRETNKIPIMIEQIEEICSRALSELKEYI